MPSSTAARANARARGSKKPAMNVLAAMSAAHWAIHPDLLRTMCAIAARVNPTIDAIESERGAPLENTYSVTLRDGIATIPVHGVMFRYADLFSYMSGGATYESLSEDFLVALNDPAVRGILFDGDSAGGEVHGCQGFATLIANAREQKPMAWFAGGDTCSAAYWLASATGRIVAAPTSIVGSIGCCTIITDFSKWQAEQGIEEIQIVSSQSPKKNRDPATPEGRSDIQIVLDDLAQVFIEDVADYRAVSVETVLSDFGQGGVFVGAAAVSAGLADDVGVYDDVHTELRDRAAGGRTTTVIIGAGRAPTPTAEHTMADKTKQPAAGAQLPAANADGAPAGDTKTDPDAPAKDDEDKDKKKKDEETQPTAGDAVSAERKRILGIQALRRNASEDATIATCVADASCSIADAALRLRQAEASAGQNHIAALRADESNAPAPKAGAGSGSDDLSEAGKIRALSDSIANAGKPADQRTPR